MAQQNNGIIHVIDENGNKCNSKGRNGLLPFKRDSLSLWYSL